MEGSNCGGEGGWTKIGLINMSEPGTTCPTGLTEKQYNSITYNLCVNNYLSSGFGCTIIILLFISCKGVSRKKE